MGTKYILSSDTIIYKDSEKVWVFRRGIWNYYETIINLEDEQENVINCIQYCFSKLQEGEVIDIEDIESKFNLSDLDLSKVKKIFNELINENLVISEEHYKTVHQIIYNMLNIRNITKFKKENIRIILYSDNFFVRDLINLFLKDIKNISVEIMPDETYTKIANLNLIENVDGLEMLTKLDEIKQILMGYDAVGIIMSRPSILFLLNLNRILIQLKIPMSIGILDGPFIHIMSLHPPYTACFEDFELRLRARLTETQAYLKFIKLSDKYSKNTIKEYDNRNIILNILASMVISETILLSALNTSKLLGKSLSIYIPTFEIQIQDILRSPTCPACGIINSIQEPVYINTSNFIQNLLEKLSGEKSEKY